MKDTLINFKASPEDAKRWREVLKGSGQNMSDICRKALNRATYRIEKSAQAEPDEPE